MIPEREQEALMRLTMCAREECSMCKYKYTCDFAFRFETATRCMNILADALRKTEPTISKMEQVDEPKTQTETQNSNLTFEKRTMRDCYNCKKYETEGECIECHYEPKDEPQTETEIAKAIVHKMIDDAVIAEDAYPDLRQKMHDAVDEYEPQTEEWYTFQDEQEYNARYGKE